MTAQDRYVAHQQRKGATLAKILDDTLAAAVSDRRSVRRFTSDPVEPQVLDAIVDAGNQAPSSCDRRGVSIDITTDRDDKALLGGLLVGGVGWLHRAPAILLLHADPSAYVAPGEIDFMPYLDAGHVASHLQLAAVASGLAACFINPNVRPRNRAHMDECFSHGRLLCGAVAIGAER